MKSELSLVRLIRDYPFSSLPDSLSKNPREQRIPTVVTQTWEENLFGRTHKHHLKKFRAANQDLSFVIYDAQQRDDYMLERWGKHKIHEIYSRARFGPMKVDIFRYCLIWEQGGYYFDISKGIRGSITELHAPLADEFLSIERNFVPEGMLAPSSPLLLRPRHLFIQWGFGFAPKHPILGNLIEQICDRHTLYLDREFPKPKDAILELTGPIAFTRSVWNYLETSSKGVFQLDFDFDGKGIYGMKGSAARFHKYPSYSDARHQRIFK